jgi:hypothetical protein
MIETKGIVLTPWTDAEKADAEQTQVRLDEELSAVRAQESKLATDYVALAQTLIHIREKRYWLLWEFKNWTSFLNNLHHRIEMGRTRLFQIVGVVEKLENQVSDEELRAMGLARALELKRVLTQKGSETRISDNVKQVATDPTKTLSDLRQAVFEDHNVKPEYAGDFFDMGGFYATAAERAELRRAWDLARRVDPPISPALPEWAQRKDIAIRMAQECISSWEAEVEGYQK